MKYVARLRTPNDFGLALQQARFARGLSQSALAAELGVSQSTISEMESGKATIFLRRLLSIAEHTELELSAAWVLDNSPDGSAGEADTPGAPVGTH